MRIFIFFSLLICHTLAAPAIFETAEQIVRSALSLTQSYEEAPYEATLIGDEVYERVYPSKKWACTKLTVNEESEQQQVTDGTMFWKLFNYIQGANNKEKKIPMTVPVTTHVTKTSGTELEMCFYINADEQADAAAPNNPDVYIKEEPTRTIYTRTIGGYMNTASWKTEAQELAAKLQELGVNFEGNSYWKVGYDAPFKFWNRRNEIWYLKK